MKFVLVILTFLLYSTAFTQEQSVKDSAHTESEQEDSLKYSLDDFVVVGTRTREKMIDIPYSVFRVDKEELSFGKKVSAKDVLADVPGLFLQSRYGNHDLRISIRGFGTRSNSGERGVRILQDGIPESEPDGETVIDAIDFTSLGGVEVVKGNLSSLYANAPGGVINFLSDMYFLKNYAAVTNQTGKFGLQQNGFKFGIANNENRIFFSYNARNLEGYRAHSNENQHLVNTVYEGSLADRSTVTILGNYVNGEIQQPGSLTKAEMDANPLQPAPLALSQDNRRMTKKGRIAARFKTLFGEPEENNTELELTGYGGIKELTRADNVFYTLSTRYSLGALARLTNHTQLFNRNNVFTIGMDFAHQSGPVNEFDNVYGSRGISVQNEFNESLSNLGFYALDKFTVVPERLDLFISSRFDRNVFSKNIFIPFGLTDTVRTFKEIAPKAGLSFKITPTVALYTSYGLSYDFPALSELANSPFSTNTSYSLNPDLNAQQSNTFELGIKGTLSNEESEFMRKVFFDITFFQYFIKGEIVPFIINQNAYFRNAAKTNRTGIEFGIKAEPVERVELTVNYIYSHFRYDEYIATIYSPSGTTTETYTGNTVPSIPSNIVNFILNYEFEISDDFSGLLQWDSDVISHMYADDKNSVNVAGYFYGNSMVGLNYGVGDVVFVGYAGVNNIFDKRYTGFVNINDFNGRYFEPGEPRNVYSGIKLGYKF